MRVLDPALRDALKRGVALDSVPDLVKRDPVQAKVSCLHRGWLEGTESNADFMPHIGQLVRSIEDQQIKLYEPLGRATDWAEYGLVREGDSIRCALEELAWLDPEWRESILRAAREEPCHSPPRVLGDMWLMDTKYGIELASGELPRYRSMGQRQALRALARLGAGDVLAVNLPTGEGKSLCIHRLVLSKSGLVIVVVPTTALALDQEKEALGVLPQANLPSELAYLGGRKAINEGIRERIKDGTQQVVFTSPESLYGSLLPTILQAAGGGLVHALVVDEAHVIEAWGRGFRPAFRMIPGVQRKLEEATGGSATPPRTLLLSATLTQEVLDSLRAQFAPGGRRFHVVGSLRIRSEATSHFKGMSNEGAKLDLARRLVSILPRPLYIYSTKREDVSARYLELTGQGVTRVRQVHGDTPTVDRREVIRELKEGSVDVVCANSAFGLGVNQSDVRSVLHLCVPEDLDRYYQEVGRSGRDGRGSVGILLWTERDFDVAKSLGREKIIGNEKGLSRWGLMFASRTSDGSGSHVVRLNQQVSPNEKDRLWDRRTLVLMQEAGLLRIESIAPSNAYHILDMENWPPGDFPEYIPVTVLDEGHNQEARWEERVDPLRRSIYQAADKRIASMRDVLTATDPLDEALQSTYALSFPGDEKTPGGEGHSDVPTVGFSDPVPLSRTWGGPAVDHPVLPTDRRLSYMMVPPGETVEEFAVRNKDWFIGQGYREWWAEGPRLMKVFSHGVSEGNRDLLLWEGAQPPRSPWLRLHAPDKLVDHDYYTEASKHAPGLVLVRTSARPNTPGRSLEDEIGGHILSPELLERVSDDFLLP